MVPRGEGAALVWDAEAQLEGGNTAKFSGVDRLVDILIAEVRVEADHNLKYESQGVIYVQEGDTAVWCARIGLTESGASFMQVASWWEKEAEVTELVEESCGAVGLVWRRCWVRGWFGS